MVGRRIPYSTSPTRLLIAAVLVLVLTSVLPLRFIRWLDGVSTIGGVILTPISGPLSGASAWLRPARSRADDVQLREYADKIDSLEAQVRQEREENARLRRVITDLQRGMELIGNAPVRAFVAPVVGAPSSAVGRTLKVRAGSSQGVSVESGVATAGGAQLVGRVVRAEGRQCEVLPITARLDDRSGAKHSMLRATIMVDDAGRGRACSLAAMGDGTLAGPIDYPETDPASGAVSEVKPQQLVRLDDSTWPAHVHHFIVGRVETIAPDAKQPLRQRVVVRPTIDLDRLSEVIMRVVVEGPR